MLRDCCIGTVLATEGVHGRDCSFTANVARGRRVVGEGRRRRAMPARLHGLLSPGDHPWVMGRIARALTGLGPAVGQRVDGLPLPLLLAGPAALLAGIALALPDAVRLAYTIDLEIYRRDGIAILGGLAPYRDVAVEYPPLALIPMLLPLLDGPGTPAV